MKNKILVSACLLGENCKYSGGNNYNIDVVEYVKKHEYLAICPEQMAGLPTPRTPIEIKVIDGERRVIDQFGQDYTDKMMKACHELEKLNGIFHSNMAILKAKSPSCGYKEIYDGTFTHTVINGNGYACECLVKIGIKIYTENDMGELK